jgi:hypothetical protein
MTRLGDRKGAFRSPREARVYELLGRLISEGSAQYFADACDLLECRPPYRTTTHIIAHLLREIESGVRDVLETLPKAQSQLAVLDRERKEKAKADKIQARQEKNTQPEKQSKGDGKDTHAIEIKAILHALSLDEHTVLDTWLAFARGDDALHAAAHRRDLRSPRSLTDEFRARFDRFVDVLVVVLDAAEARYAELLQGLEAVLKTSTPTASDADHFAKHIGIGVTALTPLFETFTSAWLAPLRERHVFDEPPEPIVSPDRTISFPTWPAARYLARIAPELPLEVTATIESVPVVDNESIHTAFLEAAAQMPTPEATRIAAHEAPWLGSHRWRSGLLPVAVTVLIQHLIDGGALDAAAELLRASLLLAPQPEEGQSSLVPRFNAWAYGKMVRETIPRLVERDSGVATKLLSELLDVERQPSAWLRRLVRRAVRSEHAEPFDQLVDQLRAAYEQRAGKDEAALRAAVQELRSQGHALHKHLALHLLKTHGALAPALVADLAVEHLLAEEPLEEQNAVIEMLRAQLPHLRASDASRVTDALRDHTSTERVGARWSGRSDPNADVPQMARYDRLKLFDALRDSRPEAIRAEYEELVAEFGAPKQRSRRVIVGPDAPRSAAQLSALSDLELLEFLGEWSPSATANDPLSFGDARDALGRELRQAVKDDVVRFSALAREFRGQAPTYVANLCWGLHEVLQNRLDPGDGTIAPSNVDSDSMLDLVEWIAAQPAAELVNNAGMGKAEHKWWWAHRWAVEIAEDVSRQPETTPEQRRRSWNVIRTLIAHPDPSPERDANRSGDIESFSLNTVRGQALRAAISFMSELHRAGVPLDDALSLDVSQVIASRSMRANEPSLALRSTLAEGFNSIFIADRATASVIARELLPSRQHAWPDEWTAWTAFITWNPAHPRVYEMLLQSYELALAGVADADADDAGRLGSHLLRLTFQKALELAKDSMLFQFVSAASPEARHNVLDDLSRAAHNEEGQLDAETITRLKEIWQWWITLATERGDASELRAFGWSFASSHFDTPWALSTLLRILDATNGVIEWDNEVTQRLAVLAEAHPEQVVGCLAKLMNSPDEWTVLRNKSELRAALSALMSTNFAADARSIASRLVARGWLEFRDLSPTP